jgi:protein-disulfide isomerase
MRRLIDGALYVATAGCLMLALWILFRAGGPARQGLGEWWRKVQEPARISRLWPRLTAEGGRLDPAGRGIHLVEFADFQCPYCQKNHAQLVGFMKRHPEIGVVYRHLPLPMHAAAPGAARAAICAEQQGALRRLHDYFFETAAWAADTNWVSAAQAVHIPDTNAFRKCLASQATAARLSADEALARDLGITGTPTFLTRQHMARGMQDETQLEELIHVRP